jgi:hypothetical protein
VEKLAGELPRDREQIDTAKAELLQAERHDRQRLAELMRRGDDAVSDTKAVDAARAAVEGAERKHQARRLAIETADQDLGEAARACSDEWLRSELRALAKGHARAVKAADALDDALDELGRVRGVVWWLEHGLERGHAAPAAGLLGDARSSAFAMANQTPASRTNLMLWLRELIGDPPGSPHQPRDAPGQPVAPAAA